ncbi:spore germination protein [Paenibacillus sp. N1-5-1-14]|uniref:GerAB/ArcD/ProY family transporter n=1 Tax=Paenibacillus radicibacter TaxID=2972488 RepID=UPI002158D716|nr:spore germination protein [Paenibacillus radicibacter]MCR8643153.1 spore germination protein [Paenibacillus radicibacter]
MSQQPNQQSTITRTQLFHMVMQVTIGIAILQLPHRLYKTTKVDAWISIILVLLGVLLLIYMLCALCKQYPGKHVYEFLPIVFGKKIGLVLNIVYILYCIIAVSQFFYQNSQILRKWILPRTPMVVLIILILLVCIYLAIESLRIIARFIVIINLIVPLLFIIPIFAIQYSEWLYLLPIYQTDIPSILDGAKTTVQSMLGFEILLVVYPFVNGTNKQIRKSVSLSMTITAFYYLFITIICFSFFTGDELEHISEPVLYMLKAVSVRNIMRSDLYFLSLWTVLSITSITLYLFMGAVGTATIFGKKDHKPFILIMSLIILGMSFLWGIESIKDSMALFSTYYSFFTVLIIPLLALITTKIRKRFK